MNNPFGYFYASRQHRTARLRLCGSVPIWATVLFWAAFLSFGSANLLLAQSATCPSQSSFQFPLWNDGTKWNLPGLYNSIQLADIDGDYQDELLGYGPFGIEVWHWDSKGQGWVQMPAGTPRFGPTDVLMTADVDGDGQAEIIQVTPAASLSDQTVVSVWHYDIKAQVWQLAPKLQLKLPASVDFNGLAAPMIQFGYLKGSGREQLVYLNTKVEVALPALFLTATPIVYQAKLDRSGWSNIGSSQETVLPILPPAVVGGPFKLGDVTDGNYSPNGDGLLDIVLKVPQGFMVFAQKTPSSIETVTFERGQYSALPNAASPVGNFALAALSGDTQLIVAIPSGGSVTPYTYSTGQLTPLLNTGSSGQSSDPSQYATLQTVQTGHNPSDPFADTLLIMGSNELDEYGIVPTQGLIQVGKSPFVAKTRFGDDPSHYTTIQTGRVRYGLISAPQAILLARDASGVHTLLRSTNVCETGVAGFTLPQAKYFPSFTGGQAAAYSYMSNALVQGNFNIRTLYANDYASLPSYEATLAALNYPAATANLNFSQNDFDAVKTQLNAEFLAAGNTVSYFLASDAQIHNLFNGEDTALQSIVTSLNLPSDVNVNTSNPAGYTFSQILTQIISTIFFGLGANGDAAKHIGVSTDSLNSAAIAVSAIGTAIADVTSLSSSSGGGSLGGQTLVVEEQVTGWHTEAATQNAIAQTAALQNWDTMRALSDQIGGGSLSISSVQEDNALNAGLTQFQIGTWEALAPQAWEVVSTFLGGEDIQTFEDVHNLQNYSYAYVAVHDIPGTVGATYGFWVETQSTAGNSSHLPVPQAAMQELASLGINYLDVLGQRNGWQNMPSETINGTPCDYCTVPPDPPPAIPPPPVIGAPATLTVLGGGQETARTYSCANLQPAPILKQSAPVYSVFPEPLTFQVQDASGNGVPNATVQLSGAGLDPNTTTALTDSNGFASVSLLADGVVRGNYLATLRVISPAVDTSYPACAVVQKYELENAPGPAGGTVPAGLATTVTVTAKSGAPTARTWTIGVRDTSGTATAMTIHSIVLKQTSGSTCTPAPVTGSPLPIPMSGPDASGNFTANVTTDFSSCTGLTSFDATVKGTTTITLSDGSSYNVSTSGAVHNQAP